MNEFKRGFGFGIGFTLAVGVVGAIAKAISPDEKNKKS